MRMSSFIGFVFLVAAIMVAATPSLLARTSEGVEWALVEAKLMDGRKDGRARAKGGEEPGSADPIEAQLVFKGHVVEEDGDLRDLTQSRERAGDQRARLASGSRRISMPGQSQLPDAYALPTVTTEDGVLLDATGCPHFDPTTDVTSLLADPVVAVRYAAKVAEADDAAACRAAFEARIAEFAPAEPGALAGDRRLAATGLRSDSDRLLLEVYRVQLFAEVMGVDEADRQDLVDGARATIAAG